MPLTEGALTARVARARVTYEIVSRVEMNAETAARVGFDVVLRAARSKDCTGDPTCDACDRTMAGLLEIAKACVPANALHEPEPDDHSFHLRPETGFTPELQVVLAVYYGPGTFEEAGAEDASLADQVVRSLEALGVQPRVFRD